MTLTHDAPGTADLLVLNDGTLVGLQPLTEASHDWLYDHAQTEPWQWLGGVLWLDHRSAEALTEALSADGFTLRPM